MPPKTGSALLALLVSILPLIGADSASVWRSSEDGRWQLTPDPAIPWTTPDDRDRRHVRVEIDPARAYQDILGLGISFDHASCYNLSRLDPATRAETMQRLFHPELGIGMNLMRVCIGTSDFTGDPWYTYNDLPPGETDPELRRFSIERDRAYVLPTIKAARELNPDLLLYASPWSPPAWMKTNGSLLAGQLKREWYGAYARYLLSFIQAYAQEGVPIHALTVQNEPDFPNPDYPTCRWTAEDQLVFIRDHLGPLFENEKINTRIWCWDHNWNLLDFPRTILRDTVANRYVDGTAFHLYEGKVEAQSTLQLEFPDKSVYFTEGSTFGTRGAVQIIDILRHQARSYNAWVFMLDEHRKPNNGPHNASATPIERLDDNSVRYNFDYYMYGQFMKFIPRGARRLASTGPRHPAHLAFAKPDGGFVLVLANPTSRTLPVAAAFRSLLLADQLPPHSVSTYTWR
ncbi:MAG: glycosyl hydrolase [Verrucomicrobia bacterium]|nr:glycosyl hydrolase [Verrucomicrobiota bacterium]